MMQTIRLTWPSADASPNARGHWAKRARANKTMRQAAFYLAKAANLTAPEGDIHVRLTFYAPDRRHYDVDNLQARAKAYLDGIADALKVNDRMFRPTSTIAPELGGYVEVEIAG